MGYNYREEMAQDIKEYIRENESEFDTIIVKPEEIEGPA